MLNLKEYLEAHRVKTKRGITHTRIGTKPGETPIIYGGSYKIPDEDLAKFYEIYHEKVFGEKKYEFLTEVQDRKIGPICVDMDFRYPFEIDGKTPERQHNTETIFDIIQLYLEKMAELIVFTPNTHFNIFAFEKPTVNPVQTGDNCGETKDGIHIIFGIHMDRILQRMLRNKVKEDFFMTIDNLDNLKNDCTADKILDEGITNGTTNWQLYGSRKPCNEAYELIALLSVECGDDPDQSPICQVIDKEEWPSGPELLALVSARKRDNIQFPMRENINVQYQEMEKKIHVKRKNRKMKGSKNINTMDISDTKTLQEEVKKKLLQWGDEERLASELYKLKEIHDYTMALPAEYYIERNKWIRVGWALRHTSKHLFLTWMVFSSQSKEKFRFDDIPGYYADWKKWGRRKTEEMAAVTDRSIMFWVRESGPDRTGYDKWEKIFKTTQDYWLESAIKANRTHYALAILLKTIFGDKYKCTNVGRNQWYEFRNHRWKKCDAGYSLRGKISTEICSLCTQKCGTYGKLREEANKQFIASTSDDDSKKVNTKAEKYAGCMAKSAQLSDSLRTTSFKQAIMTEAKHEFYVDPDDFIAQLDTKHYLLGFKNGVFDFDPEWAGTDSKERFRPGKPDDYISMSTKIDYYPFDKTDDEQVKIKTEIKQFMEQLFPKEELREYMWQHLASTLTGKNPNETFNIYMGEGSNGKSKLIELMGLILGDYQTTIPLALITSKRPQIGSASPEVAILRGVRYAVMQEPSKGMTLNEGALKQYTGGDIMSGRELFQNPINFRPQFKLVVATNNLLCIKSNDEGTWRRIRVCDYICRFLDKKDPVYKENNPHHFIRNKKLPENLERWKYVFMAMLVEKNLETGGMVCDCESVMASSGKYRATQNYLAKFKEEMIVKEEGGPGLRKGVVWNAFKDWYRENYDAKTSGKRDELFVYLNRELGPCGTNKKNKNRWAGFSIIQEEDDDNVMGL